MKQKSTNEPLPEKKIHCEVLQAVYVHPTEPGYQHIYFAGFTLQDALNNMNRWRYFERRDRHIEPVIIIDDETPRAYVPPFS